MSQPPATSRQIGPYRLLEELGRGAQGQVFLAEDTRLSRRVALKVLSSTFSPSRETLVRFQREATAASRLDHPGICAVYEAGEAGGVHYIAMRYVEGETLAHWISRRKDQGPAPEAIAGGETLAVPRTHGPAAGGSAPRARARARLRTARR